MSNRAFALELPYTGIGNIERIILVNIYFRIIWMELHGWLKKHSKIAVPCGCNPLVTDVGVMIIFVCTSKIVSTVRCFSYIIANNNLVITKNVIIWPSLYISVNKCIPLTQHRLSGNRCSSLVTGIHVEQIMLLLLSQAIWLERTNYYSFRESVIREQKSE